MSDIFPSILPGVEFVDNEYSRDELERMEWQEIRQVAAAHPSDEITGQSDREEMEDFLEGEERL